MKFIRVKDSDVNEQKVVVDDVEIGTVWEQWFRLGGQGWTNSLCGSSGFPTRKEAGRDLARRFRSLTS
jgi:hypothetical protein